MENLYIYNLLNKYMENFNNKIYVKFDDDSIIDFYFDRKKLSHILGLHYCNSNSRNADIIAEKIINNKINDDEILDLVRNNNVKFIKAVKNRIKYIESFLDNLESAFLTLVNKGSESDINSVNFIVETNEKKILELGLAIDNSDQYYIETFLVRNNDNNIDYSINKKIKEIFIIKNNELIPFSFDQNKNIVLIEEYKNNKDFNYKEFLKEYEYNLVKEPKNNWNKKNRDNEIER
ncbi:PBECR4 domain-containing protein [Streptobacillus felis]|uniref:PBECR4 domain-containing protein n=1 Tax=Streptobacillus felis TaxID=1384509 RepID=UPI00082DF81C|nr:PBECR4 domain-containing protein [Streptobacillus felis]